jgi:hypothetical protein
MKILNKLFLISSILILSNACSLDEEPYGFLSTTNFYKTEADAVSSLAFCYDIMAQNEYYGRYLYFVGTLGTEEWTLKSDAQQDDHQIDDWTVLPTNGDIYGVWSNAYIGINRCNTTLKFVPKIETISESVLNEVLGEAHFIRALHYFNLVRIFGEVPIRTEPVLNDGNLNIAVSSMSDIYKLIEDDLLKAEELTDLTFRDGRANKVAAQALLAKVYLQLASAKASGVDKYDFVAEDYYPKAATYAEKVLNNTSGYTFWDGSKDIKALWDVDNQSGNEFIFSIAYHVSGAQSEGDFSKLSVLQTPYVNGVKMKLGPDFTTEIPDGFGHLKTEIPFYQSFKANDKRKTDLIVSDVQINSTHYTYPGTLAYPFTRKFIDKHQSADQEGHYIPVIRFSDIALVYAEAKGSTPEAYDWINKIRSRAGLADLTTGLSDAAFRDSVFVERTYELAFEGQRLFDLRRTKKMEEVLVTKYGKTLDSRAYYYDIPQQEKDLNNLIN